MVKRMDSSAAAHQQQQTKNVIAIGLVGHGKSWLLNQLYGSDSGEQMENAKSPFEESSSLEPCTKEIHMASKSMLIKRSDCTVNFYDTPGLNNNSGALQQQQQLDNSDFDQTIEQIAHVAFSQIFIVVKYAELTATLISNLEKVDLCFNRFSASSCTLVINQIPRAVTVKQIAEFYDELCKYLSSGFFNCIYVRSGDQLSPDTIMLCYPHQHQTVYTKSLAALLGESKVFPNAKMQTWNELRRVYSTKTSKSLLNKTNIARLENQIQKISSDIDWYEYKAEIGDLKSRNELKNSTDLVDMELATYCKRMMGELTLTLEEKKLDLELAMANLNREITDKSKETQLEMYSF